MRIGFVAEPPGIVISRENDRHPIMNVVSAAGARLVRRRVLSCRVFGTLTSSQTISLHSPMSSLADASDLVGFFSYSREDDEDSGGKLSKLRERIQAELRGQLGRTKRDFRLWQDKVAIAHGELWEDTIKKGISEAVFFRSNHYAYRCQKSPLQI